MLGCYRRRSPVHYWSQKHDSEGCSVVRDHDRIPVAKGRIVQSHGQGRVTNLSSEHRVSILHREPALLSELTQLDPIRSGRVQLSIGSAQPIDEMRLYLKEHGLGVAYILGLRPTGLRIAGTPTIVLADSRGLVLNVWRGLLNRDRQKDVVGAVVKLGGKAGL